MPKHIKKERVVKVYKHIYDIPKNEDGTEKPNILLGEFEIIYGDMDDYAFSIIGISKADGQPYNIVGDEISRVDNPYSSGTILSINRILLQRPYIA